MHIAFAWRLTTHTNSGVDTLGFQIKIAVWNHLNFEVQQHIRFICNLSENIKSGNKFTAEIINNLILYCSVFLSFQILWLIKSIFTAQRHHIFDVFTTTTHFRLQLVGKAKNLAFLFKIPLKTSVDGATHNYTHYVLFLYWSCNNGLKTMFFITITQSPC